MEILDLGETMEDNMAMYSTVGRCTIDKLMQWGCVSFSLELGGGGGGSLRNSDFQWTIDDTASLLHSIYRLVLLSNCRFLVVCTYLLSPARVLLPLFIFLNLLIHIIPADNRA